MDSLRRDQRFRELQSQYLEEVKGQLQRWSTRLEQPHDLPDREFEELLRFVHNVKGSGGGYGFPALTDMAAGIEAAMETGITRADLNKMLSELLWLHLRLCDDLANR